MKKLSSVRSAIFTSLLLLPFTLHAQTTGQVTAGINSFSQLIDTVTNTVIKSTASLFMALALLAFFYGLVEYIWARRDGDASKIKDGNRFMVWGLVALFVMLSVYGIIKFAQTTLFQNADMTTITIPKINFGGGSGSTPAPSTAPTSPGATTSECSGVVTGTSCRGGLGSCQNGSCVLGGSTVPSTTTNPPTTITGLGEGVGCADTSQCAPGLTCLGGTSSKICTAGGSTAPSGGTCLGNTGGVNCGCTADCNSPMICSGGSCMLSD